MRILVAGGNGFIGKAVCAELKLQGHEVLQGVRNSSDEHTIPLDLLNAAHIEGVLNQTQPTAIINCAGVTGGGDFEDNVRFTKNLLDAADGARVKIGRMVICGSAGVYGNVKRDQWPVKESTPLSATSPYGLSKIEEENTARKLAKAYGIDLVVARIFNPIGMEMPDRFLLSSIVRQVGVVASGDTDRITLSRADSLRDYIDVRDVARALAILATRDHQCDTYNVGSGVATATNELVRRIIGAWEIDGSGIAIEETAAEPEDPVASEADISRMKDEFAWSPIITLQDTIEGVLKNERSKK